MKSALRIHEMWLMNFMRFRKAHVKLSKAGMVLIEGKNLDDESAVSNGAGKSTIADALLWCLYGVTTHEPAIEGDDVVNEKRQKNCKVTVTFKLGEAMYCVERMRAWKKGGKPVQLEFFTFDPNTTGGGTGVFTKGTIKETQAAIERVIGMSATTFQHACIFGQSRAYRFSRLNDGDKKAVLDEMLGSEMYAEAAELAGKRLAAVEPLLEKALNAIQNATESRQEAVSRLDKLRERSKAQALLAQTENEELAKALAAANRELGELKFDAAEFKRLGGAMQEARAKRDKQARLYQEGAATAKTTATRIDELEAKRSRLVKLEETECVTCKQTITTSHVKKQLETIDDRIEEANNADAKAQAFASNQKETLRELTQRLEASEELYEKLRERERTFERLQERKAGIESKQAKLNRSIDFTEMIRDEEETIAKLTAKIEQAKTSAEEQTKEAAQLKFWRDGFGTKGLRSLMLDAALPYLNAKLERYANALTAGNIRVRFKTQRRLKGGGLRDDFHVAVKNKFGSSHYKMNSIGERAKIDIIVGLALQDMAAARSRTPINVAFFDEVFDGLDSMGVDRAVQTLSELRRESAFVITHHDGLKAFFQKRITVIKEDGESRLEAT